MSNIQKVRILGIMVQSRGQQAEQVQSLLTKYGCSIRTRLGLNTLDVPGEEESGLILLELTGDHKECLRLENDLLAIDKVRVQKMVF